METNYQCLPFVNLVRTSIHKNGIILSLAPDIIVKLIKNIYLNLIVSSRIICRGHCGDHVQIRLDHVAARVHQQGGRRSVIVQVDVVGFVIVCCPLGMVEGHVVVVGVGLT